MRKAEALQKFREVMMMLRLQPGTVTAYLGWAGQYIDFLASCPAEMPREEKVGKFLSRLVMRDNVAWQTQKQALCAVKRFHEWVVKVEIGKIIFARSTRPKYLPVVFSREEAWRIVDKLDGVGWLWGAVFMYGCGLRLAEVCSLRVKDVDLDRMMVHVREGKGLKDRYVPLPQMAAEPLRKYLRNLREVYETFAAARVSVSLPGALDRKYPNAPFEWPWFWFFPASAPAKDPKWGGKLWHVHPTAVQKRVRRAILAAKIPKKASCHTFRHSFATHWLELAEGSHEVALLRLQKLLGHAPESKTVWTYLHLLKPKSDVPSPLDARPQETVVQFRRVA